MRLIRRVFLGLFLLLVALVAFLAVSIAVDAALGAGRLDEISNISISGTSGGPDVQAYVARPQGEGLFPVVIMIHEFWGLNESIVSKADLLAEEGYLVVAPDTFRGSTTSWIPRAIFQVVSTQSHDVNADLDSVYAWLQGQPDVDAGRIAIAGFCYGGRTSLTYSLHNNQLAATVIFYGSPETDPNILKTLPGPVLGIFGGADQSIPLEQVQAFDAALTKAGVPHQVTIYEGQPHAFVQDAGSIQAGRAQSEAWNEMLAFLESNLVHKAAGENQLMVSTNRAPFAWKYYAMLVYEHALGTASHTHENRKKRPPSN